MSAHVVIVHPDGGRDVAPLVRARTTLGRSFEAAIAVHGATELEETHLELTPMKGGCWVATSPSAAVPTLLDGREIRGELVPWGSRLTLGRHALVLGLGDARSVMRAPSRGAPRVAIVALATLTLVLIAARGSGSAGALDEGPAPSPLYDAPPTCEGDRAVSMRRAAHAVLSATARDERFYFDFQDGIAAVHDYDLALACLESAGADDQLDAVRERRVALVARIDEAYARLRLRLARAMGERDDARALATLAQLRELTRHRDDAYTRDLASTERAIAVRATER